MRGSRGKVVACSLAAFVGSFAGPVGLAPIAAGAQTAAVPAAPVFGGEKLQDGLGQLSTSVPRAVAGTPSIASVPVRSAGTVAIDATATGDADELLGDLQALGLQSGAAFGRMVGGLLPVGSLPAASKLGSLKFARPAASRTDVGLTTSQGVRAMRADTLQAAGITGAGLTVGSMSDSYNCLGGAAADVASNDLPAGVNVLDDTQCVGATDEGRGMMQLIHDTSPGVAQAFHTASPSQANFAQGMLDLAAAGSDIIDDDVTYFAEPFFADGILAQAADQVVGMGIPFFSSAGNQARRSYEAPFRATATNGCSTNRPLHDFDPGGGIDTRQRFSIPGNRSASLSFQWDQPYASTNGASPGSASDLALCVYSTGGALLFTVNNANVGNDPVEIMTINCAGPGACAGDLAIALNSGAAPGLMKYVVFGPLTFSEFNTNSGTIFGHHNAAGAVATGAARFSNTPAFGVNPPLQEPFSSAGGVPILFNTLGAPIAPITRPKPEVVAPDGGNTTFFGTDIPDDPDAFPNFFGTSAAAPHSAGLSALILQLEPTLTPAQLRTRLETTAIDMAAAGFDFDTGFGLIQATRAVNPAVLCAAATPGPGAIVLTADNDTFTGGPGDDVIFALGGQDSVDGGGGNDLVLGGDGNDQVVGADGDDLLCGGNGHDQLRGGNGNDSLSGDAGNDALLGEAGNDTLVGGQGFDSLDGGTGTNTNDGGTEFDSCINGANTNCP